MDLTVIRWACLFVACIAHLSGNTALGMIFAFGWFSVGMYQIKTGRF